MIMRRWDPGKLRKTEIDGYWGSRRSGNRISLLNFWTLNGQSLDLRGRISGLFKPDLDLITRGSSEYRQRTQSNGYWNCAKVSERVKKRSYSNRGDYRRDEGRSWYRNSRYEPSRGYAQEDRNRFARGSRRETSQLRDVMEEDHEEGEFQNKEDHQGDKEIPQTKNVLAVQMELTLPQIVSYVVILDSIRMEDGVDLGNKMLEEGINGLREDVMVLDDKHVNMSGKGKKENDDDKFLNITDDLMYQYIIGKQLWSSVVVFDSFGFSILISSWSILICLLNAFTLVFFMLLLMVTSFYKIMRWNKTGLLAYWYWCFCVLLRNAFIKILFVNGMLDIQRRTLWLCGLLCFKFTYWNRTQKWNMVFIVLALLWLVSLNQT
ncbi:unnamed protein product, partial [Brassica oleracea]